MTLGGSGVGGKWHWEGVVWEGGLTVACASITIVDPEIIYIISGRPNTSLCAQL